MRYRIVQFAVAVGLSLGGLWTAAGIALRWAFRTEIQRGES